MRQFLLILLLVASLVGCQKKAHSSGAQAAESTTSPTQAPVNRISGKVLEQIDASPYTFLRIQSPKGEVWAAVPDTKIEKGAGVAISNPVQMNNFESKKLNRKFDVVFFGTLDAPAVSPSPDTQPATVAKGPDDAPGVKVEMATGGSWQVAKIGDWVFLQKHAIVGPSLNDEFQAQSAFHKAVSGDPSRSFEGKQEMAKLINEQRAFMIAKDTMVRIVSRHMASPYNVICVEIPVDGSTQSVSVWVLEQDLNVKGL